MRKLVTEGVLVGGPTLNNGLPYPDGDEIIDLHAKPEKREALRKEAESLPKALLTDIDVNWLQTIAEGWAAPLKGFMREGTLLQTMHFNTILVDPKNITGAFNINEVPTNFNEFGSVLPPKRVSMSVPIVLPITAYTKAAIEGAADKKAVALVNKFGNTLGVLRNPEIYVNRKEEIVSRIFGVIDMGHPYIKHIYGGGDWLLGGEIELFDRIKYNDDLDQHRLSSTEVIRQFESRGADAVYAFQTRNPTHAGHAYLMKTGLEMLKKQGYQNPILWLSPLGGWTKSDDVPLDVRVNQHEAILGKELDAATTIMAIWPAPMIYAGPTEVLFHAKSRRNAAATHFGTGRDPAGMKGSSEAFASPDDDLYDPNHGRYILTLSPGQEPMTIIPFGPFAYDITDHSMKARDPKHPENFIDISGSKMRKLAAQNAQFCDASKPMPIDLLAANCIPPGFMVKEGWDIVCDFYQNENTKEWVPYSVMNDKPFVASSAVNEGKYGSKSFMCSPKVGGGIVSPWHDIALKATETLYNMVVEIPMYSTAKMEMIKEIVGTIGGNPIMQDIKDDKPRYYTYGVPFFNYGLLPKTWEDPNHTDPHRAPRATVIRSMLLK